MNLKPSHFTSFPYSSTLQNSESETIALNIQIIRSQTGDEWPKDPKDADEREANWGVYKARRISHGNDFTQSEREYFDRVYPLVSDPISAIAFAPKWAADAKRATKQQ